MPKDYDPTVTPPSVQRRREHALDDDATRELIGRLEIAHIATVWGAQPFVNPTTFWFEAAAQTIFFHSNAVGRVRANVGHHDRVCFESSRFGPLLV